MLDDDLEADLALPLLNFITNLYLVPRLIRDEQGFFTLLNKGGGASPVDEMALEMSRIRPLAHWHILYNFVGIIIGEIDIVVVIDN